MSRLPDRTRAHRNVTPARRYESSIFPNTTVERFDNIDNIMRRLCNTPVDMSGIEKTMRRMRDALRYIESAWKYHGASPDLIHDVCTSLQRAVNVMAEDIIDSLATVNVQLSNLRSYGGPRRTWTEGALEIPVRTDTKFNSWRDTWVMYQVLRSCSCRQEKGTRRWLVR